MHQWFCSYLTGQFNKVLLGGSILMFGPVAFMLQVSHEVLTFTLNL